MKISLSLSEEMEKVSKKVVWHKKPEEAIQNPLEFIAHVLTYGTFEDIQVLRTQITNKEIKYALDNAPAGIFDKRSWSYWNTMLGRYPAPPLPSRNFE